MTRRPLGILLVLAALGLAFTAPARAADAARCRAMAGIAAGTGGDAARIDGATVLDAPGAPACALTGVIAPGIHFALRLPLQSWNGRYLQTGCGGYCGVVRIDDAAPRLRAGYAVAAQDMGHRGDPLHDPSWGADPALRRDFAWRSTHVVALAAKALVARFYGRPARHAYFEGCSTGGREGLSEAQRFPADFDGIVAGDPAFNGRLGGIANVWDAQHLFQADGRPVIAPAHLALLHRAVLAACDALDGLADGIIADPRRCRFDVRRLACVPGGTPDCLSPTEIDAAVAVYDGPRDRKGRRLIPGHGLFGAEVGWDTPKAVGLADGNVRYLDFWPEPPSGFGYRDIDFDRDLPLMLPQVALYDPVAPHAAPDLDAFRRRGGRLIAYQGWADPGVSALMILDYRAQLLRRSPPGLDRWFRLFMVPGMLHCRGGDAPNSFDTLPALVDWVERGRPPERIVAAQKQDQETLRSRPLVPYPAEARYAGRGDPDDAANWKGVRPAHDTDDRLDWVWAPP